MDKVTHFIRQLTSGCTTKTFQMLFLVIVSFTIILGSIRYFSPVKVQPQGLSFFYLNVADQPSQKQKHKVSRNATVRTTTTLTGKKNSMIIVRTNTGLRQTIILDRKHLFVELPFSSYYATLTVVLKGNIASVLIHSLEVRSCKYVLGLGVTKTSVKIYYNNQTEPRSYRVDFIRKSRVIAYTSGQTCYLEQDCDRIIYKNRKCGPQAMKHWKPAVNIQGYWKLNCSNCSMEQTCLWSQAEWIEANGSPVPLHHNQIKTCLQDHQVLFLGDSTNRGLMQSFMEKVNTTLTHAVLTHGSLVYENIGLSTGVCFTYYNPILPECDATFNESLQHLADICLAKKSCEKSLLVVGGVQWLNSAQLKELNEFTTRKGIPSNNVYIKLYGAGFHEDTGDAYTLQKVRSVEELTKQNNMLRKLAESYGFQVVDMLQMTLSRYKEFRFGPCACHFHEIRKYLVNGTQTFYHIDGDINERYTDILIRKMCSP